MSISYYNDPGNKYDNLTGAKVSQPCVLQARLLLRVDEVSGQQHGEVDKGIRARTQLECSGDIALAS